MSQPDGVARGFSLVESASTSVQSFSGTFVRHSLTYEGGVGAGLVMSGLPVSEKVVVGMGSASTISYSFFAQRAVALSLRRSR